MEQDAKKILFKRLDDCLKAHADMLDAGNIGSIYELQDLSQFHYYLKAEHEFTSDEVEALLEFQDPLEVAWCCKEQNTHAHRLPFCELMEKINAYDRFQPQDEYTGLMLRLGRNYYAFYEGLASLDKETLIEKAQEIAATQEAYSYLTTEFEFKDDMLSLMLTLENPLKYIADNWPVPVSVNFDLDGPIQESIEYIVASPEYTLQKQPSSIRERLRNAAQEVKEQPEQKKAAIPKGRKNVDAAGGRIVKWR